MTPSRCREELRQVNRFDLVTILMIAFGLFMLAFGVFGLYYLEAITFERVQGDCLFALGLVGILGAGGGVFFGIPYVRTRKIDRMVLEIVEDKLLFPAMRYSESRSRRYYCYYVLVFRYFGEYRIPSRPHYTWSKRFSADRDRDLYERAEPFDTYYIVLDRNAKRKKPLLIYNTKEFVFCPDGTTGVPDHMWRDSVSDEE